MSATALAFENKTDTQNYRELQPRLKFRKKPTEDFQFRRPAAEARQVFDATMSQASQSSSSDELLKCVATALARAVVRFCLQLSATRGVPSKKRE